MPTDGGWCDIEWLHPDGRPMLHEDWNGSKKLALLFSTHPDQKDSSPVVEAVAILFNASKKETVFRMPGGLPPVWSVEFSSSDAAVTSPGAAQWTVPAHSMILVTGTPDS
jgi:pullulanase/glycogen debranching enzyme